MISNAADACEKLRYEAIAEPQLTSDGEGFVIRVLLDKDAKTLSVVDNGIGMSRDDLDKALGTIASSGTKAFLDKIGNDAEAESGNLIGQFGIGFYSAFMVADRVAGEDASRGPEPTRPGVWDQRRQGRLCDSLAARLSTRRRRAARSVTLHMNEASAGEYPRALAGRAARQGAFGRRRGADRPRREARMTSRAGSPTARRSGPRTSPRLSPEQYAEFYRGARRRQYDEPALTIHYRAEGRHEYSVLAFVPRSKPFRSVRSAAQGPRPSSYVRRVLISDEADLLPGWLRFVRAVVDTADLPLNVSREMVQSEPRLRRHQARG